MPKLTKKLIDAAQHPSEGQIFLRDSEIKGFALRLTSGSKTFVLEKVVHGRFTRLTIGRYGELTLDQARDRARKTIVNILDGQDPAADRRTRQTTPTFSELERLYLDRHAIHKKSASNDVTLLNLHLAGWRSRRLSAITRADVSTRHADMGATGSPRMRIG